jgi:long-subunit fatty acid transport protein
MVLSLTMRLVYKSFVKYDSNKNYLSHISLNDAFNTITGAIVNLRDVLDESLEIKYPSSVSTKIINNALDFRNLKIEQTLNSDAKKMATTTKKKKK